MALSPVSRSTTDHGGTDNSIQQQVQTGSHSQTGSQNTQETSQRNTEAKSVADKISAALTSQQHVEEGNDSQRNVTAAHRIFTRTTGGGTEQLSAVHEGIQVSFKIKLMPNMGG